VGRLGLAIFEDALRVLETCPDNCDRSCYRCLRSFRNKFEHDLLDRHVGASLLRFALAGQSPTLDARRLERSADLLFQDLDRHGIDGLKLERNKTVSIPGLDSVVAPILAADRSGAHLVIALHGPLTPDAASDEALSELKEFSAALPVRLVDELVVRRNLPSATASLLDKMGYAQGRSVG
jgi:hypothetical protein